MAKIAQETICRWRGMAEVWLANNTRKGNTRADVLNGIDAWTIAHRCGITNDAYQDRDIVDAHIQTALEKIFPNCLFKDKKVY